jgi:HK97 family phage portal protein
LSNTAKLGFTDSEELTKRVSAKLTHHIRLGALASTEFRAAGLTQFELWREMFPDNLIGYDPKTPGITEKSGQKLAVVFSCLNVLGETYGSLPCDVKQNTAKGKVTLNDDPIHYLVHDRPNPYTTAFDFWSTMQKLRKAWGNAYAEIQRHPDGVPKSFWLRMPWEVTLKQSPSNEVYYEYQGRIIAYPDMLHFKNYSENGFTGISSIRHNALTMGLGLKLKNYNSSIIGDRPYGYLSSATRPKDGQAKKAMQDQWQNPNKEEGTASESNRYKMGTMGGIPVLYGGLEFHSMTLPADDVQYIESAKLTEREIYGIFRMPPTMVEDWEKAPYNSSEQQDIVFVKYTLADIRGVEQECNEKLFPESNKRSKEKKYIKFNLQGLLRGDTATRVQLYRTLVNLGAMSPKQVADLEDLKTDGVSEEYFMQLNMAPVDILGEVQKAKAGGNAAARTEEQRQQIIEELREQIRARLNGHYKDVADILED